MDENCQVEAFHKTATAEDRRYTTSSVLTVWGMGCPNCGTRVRNSLLSLSGVVEAHILLEAGLVDITYNPDLADVPALVDAVAQAGSDGRHHYRAQVWAEQAAPVIW